MPPARQPQQDDVPPPAAPPGEAASLRGAWERHSARHLDSYLVSGREDPRINPQSILTRALVADSLWPGQFDALIDAELVFGATLTGFLTQIEAGADRAGLAARLPDGAPEYAAAALALPPEPDAEAGAPFARSVLDTFVNLWHRGVSGLAGGDGPGARPRLAEAACGSANDYRFLDATGLAAAFEYTGFDIAPKNIANARRRFPDTRFAVADACDPPFDDGEFDYVFAHDLYEHLSLEALEAALAATLRIARREAWLHFFNLGTGADHELHPVGGYHWNLLSEGRVVASLQRYGAATVEVVRTAELLRSKAPQLPPYPNPGAATLIVTLDGGEAGNPDQP